jgi:hypothetical protein
MFSLRDSPDLVTATLVDVKLIGQDTDPGHFVGLVLRGPDGEYSFDPCIAASTPYGSGWSGRHGVPTLTTDVSPVLGSDMTFRFGNSLLEDTFGYWAIGFQPTALPTTLGGTLNVVPFSFLPVSVPAAGFELLIPVDTNPFLCGLSTYHQLFLLDDFASDGLSFSRGLQLQLGH